MSGLLHRALRVRLARALSTLLFGLAAVSVLAASTVHATEAPAAVPHCHVGELESSHEESPSEKSVPAGHAACHSPVMAMPSLAPAPDKIAFREPAPHAMIARTLVSEAGTPHLRPPIS